MAVREENIPTLTEVVSESDSINEDTDVLMQLGFVDREALIAELQTRLASGTFDLADNLMRDAFAEMEAKIYKQISSSLREQLPELIDSIIRKQLDEE